MPDTVPGDPDYIAKVVSAAYDTIEKEKAVEEPVDITSDSSVDIDEATGFTVETITVEEDI